MNCSIYGAFFCESDLLRSLSRGCVPSPFFLGVHFDSGFAGASELSEPGSFLWAIGSLASELSEVEVLLSSRHWSGACSLSGAGSQSELLLPC